MTNPLPENKQSQKVEAGRNATVVGRDYTRTTNISFWISFFLIGVLALGGLAWALNFIQGGANQGGNPTQAPQSSPASTK